MSAHTTLFATKYYIITSSIDECTCRNYSRVCEVVGILMVVFSLPKSFRVGAQFYNSINILYILLNYIINSIDIRQFHYFYLGLGLEFKFLYQFSTINLRDASKYLLLTITFTKCVNWRHPFFKRSLTRNIFRIPTCFQIHWKSHQNMMPSFTTSSLWFRFLTICHHSEQEYIYSLCGCACLKCYKFESDVIWWCWWLCRIGEEEKEHSLIYSTSI